MNVIPVLFYSLNSFVKGKSYLPVLFRLSLILGIFISSPFIHSQSVNKNFKIERISTDQGLSQSTVECIFRDTKGFMWFGTEEGLNRFDGYNFTIYKNDHNNPVSLSNEVVFSIYEDFNGTLWIGTRDGGLNKFNREKERFTSYKYDPENINSLSDNKINSIYESPSLPGVLWISTETGGLNKFDIATGEVTHFKHNPNNKNSLSSNRLRSIHESLAYPGILWIGTAAEGLNKFDIKDEKFTHFKYSAYQSNGLSNNEIWAIHELSDMPGILWIGTKNGLNKFDIKTLTFKHYKSDPSDRNSLSHNEVTCVFGSPDEPKTLYIGTMGGGLNKMFIPAENSGEKSNSAKTIFVHYRHEPGNINSLSSDNIISLFEDKRHPGVMWVGTFDAGLTKIYKSKKKFYHFKNEPGNNNSLVNNVVWAICEDQNGTIWVGTHEGLSEIRRNEFGEVIFKNHKHSSYNHNTLSNDIVTTIVETRSKPGIIWLGTYGGGLTKLISPDNKNESIRFTHYKNDPADKGSISSNEILTIRESIYDKNSLWIGTARGGLNKFNIEENKFISYKNNPTNTNSLSNNNVHVIWESMDDPDILWIGTLGGGLNKFNTKTQSFTLYNFDINNSKSISSDIVLSLYQSNNSPEILWVGTAEGGLNKLDIKSGFFTHYTSRDGLPNNTVNGILEDEKGNLWISTNKGLSRFNIQSNTFRNYDIHDGLQDNEFNGNACFSSKSGDLFFGGMNGFNSFYPSEINDNPNIPTIVLTDFKIFNRSISIRDNSNLNEESDNDLIYLEKSISETDLIKLSYKHNFFSFDFAALDFASPAKNQYAYMMEGFDEDWVYTGNRRFASYTNLDPGEYIFKVKGTNNDGIWNEQGTFIKIIIQPPFWKTWWFLSIFWLVVTMTVLGTVRYYSTRKLKRQIEKLEREREMEKERTRISRDMHDEVGSSLTEIAILSELVRNNIYKPDEVVSHLNNISCQIAEIIDNIGQIIWAINPKNDPLENLISYLRNFALKYLNKANIKCDFKFDDQMPDFQLSAEVRRNIFLVLKESLNNIVKHSKADFVEIKIITENSTFGMMIIDNGDGIIKKVDVGNGLINMQKRIEEIDGVFEILSDMDKGTTIKLSVPLYKQSS